MKYQGFVDRFKGWKAEKNLTNYKIEKATGYSRANLTNLEKGLIGPSDDLIEKLAAIPEYGLSEAELKAWRAIDENGPEAIKLAAKYVAEYELEDLKAIGREVKAERGKEKL